MAKKQLFGIFAPILGERKDFPVILLDKVIQTDNSNIFRRYGEVRRRLMREPDFLTQWDVKYEANVEPDSDGWTLGGTDYASVADGILTIETTANAQMCYYIRENDINFENGLEIQFKAQVISSSGNQPFEVTPLDKTNMKYTNLILRSDSIYHEDVLICTFNTTDAYHIYKMIILGTTATLYIDEVEKGSWQVHQYYLGGTSRVFFGTTTDSAYCSIKIDYLYYNYKTEYSKTQTPDGNPILHYHRFVRRLDGAEYRLAFTKAHIYHWNPATFAYDSKFTCASDCTEWDTVTYNNKVIATNNVDKVLVWNTEGNFVALDDTTNGIEYNRVYSNETNVDETSTKDQKVLKVKATTGYVADDKVMIGEGTLREEEGVVNTVQAGESLTLVGNLTYEHTADAETTVNVNSAEGQKVLSVTSTVGFSVSEYVIINLNGDRAEVRKIASIQAGTSLTMTVNLTYAHTQAQGDKVIGTNGQNDKVEEYVSNYLTKAKYVNTFENFLILGYTTENSILYPQRERWNAIGDETSWRKGDAGSKETEGSDPIVGFKIYSGQFIIFKTKGRIAQVLVPTSAVWNWQRLPGNIGCLSNHSIVEDADGRIYWLANDLTIREMEEGEISQDIDPVVKKIEPSSAHLVQGVFIEETGEIWWSIPFESTLNSKVITLKGLTSWGELNLSIPAFGDYYEA